MSGDFSNIYNISSSTTISISTSICNEINFSSNKSQIICTIGEGKSNQQIKLSDGNGATLINDEFYYRVPCSVELVKDLNYDTDDYYHEYSIPHWVIVIPKRFKCGSGSGSSSISNARLKKLSTLLVIKTVLSTASSLLQNSIHHRHKKLLTLFVIKTVLSLFQISIYKRPKKLLTLFGH
ncbi:hypothetical protein ACTFIR_005272 [Dictyostelium discoideum]